ncbi:hypothetical protein HOLleu_06689 [Holothuria leucospilota]|uniref:Uncharacterized protein n=1 Tax=Holothuria leucospilota TaxID=206669 RepID=A0A9Q1CL92_HOLLE|nr:hypothetical protein HOLleu_06689 [Holothuria leucospilota]
MSSKILHLFFTFIQCSLSQSQEFSTANYVSQKRSTFLPFTDSAPSQSGTVNSTEEKSGDDELLHYITAGLLVIGAVVFVSVIYLFKAQRRRMTSLFRNGKIGTVSTISRCDNGRKLHSPVVKMVVIRHHHVNEVRINTNPTNANRSNCLYPGSSGQAYTNKEDSNRNDRNVTSSVPHGLQSQGGLSTISAFDTNTLYTHEKSRDFNPMFYHISYGHGIN